MYQRKFQVPVPRGFRWEITVRSFGFYLLAPNGYDAETKEFRRPLRVGEETVVQATASISESGEHLLVCADSSSSTAPLSEERWLEAEQEVSRQLRRMFRLDVAEEELQRLYDVLPAAKEVGFGRMFRSPTLFEDMVKAVTSCNTSFANTAAMNRLLCLHAGAGGAFPTPRQVADLSEKGLRTLCKVGYRDARIHRLALRFLDGDFDDLESLILPSFGFDPLTSPLHQQQFDDALGLLSGVDGYGPFSISNVLQLLGAYSRVPTDSESRRLQRISQKSNALSPTMLQQKITSILAPYHPFQFLVYWFELYEYARRFSIPGDGPALPTPNEAQMSSSIDQASSVPASSSVDQSSSSSSSSSSSIFKSPPSKRPRRR